MTIDTTVARVSEIVAMQQALFNPASAVGQPQVAAHAASASAAGAAGGQTFATQLASASAAQAGTVIDPKLGPTTNPIPGATGGRLNQGMDGTSKTFVSPFNGK